MNLTIPSDDGGGDGGEVARGSVRDIDEELNGDFCGTVEVGEVEVVFLLSDLFPALTSFQIKVKVSVEIAAGMSSSKDTILLRVSSSMMLLPKINKTKVTAVNI